MLVAGAVLVVSLHLISPERVIVASHLDGVRDPAKIDFEYLESLGIGAVEPLMERFDQLPTEVQERLLVQWTEEFHGERRGVAMTFVRWRAERRCP